MKTTKRLLAILLALVLLCSALPFAFAEGNNATIYGTDGNLVWTLDNKGVLTINGEGPMPDEYYFDPIPSWKQYANRITTAIISAGVTSIGHGAFTNCDCLTSITIPDMEVE